MPGEQALAERQTEALDLGAGMLRGRSRARGSSAPRRGASPADLPSTNASAKSPSKRQRDGQVPGVVPIAAADDPQHAELRFAVAAGADAEHGDGR